jgi:hypothetical protein
MIRILILSCAHGTVKRASHWAVLSGSPPPFDQRKAIQIELAPVPHGKSGNDNGR